MVATGGHCHVQKASELKLQFEQLVESPIGVLIRGESNMLYCTLFEAKGKRQKGRRSKETAPSNAYKDCADANRTNYVINYCVVNIACAFASVYSSLSSDLNTIFVPVVSLVAQRRASIFCLAIDSDLLRFHQGNTG